MTFVPCPVSTFPGMPFVPYLGHLEQVIFEENHKPSLYARYVDDIFLQVDDLQTLIDLKSQFENNSVLNFTYELNVNGKLPFLDVAYW